MNMKNNKTNKGNSKATDLTQRNRRARRRYWTAATVFAVFLMSATPALAASDPLTIGLCRVLLHFYCISPFFTSKHR